MVEFGEVVDDEVDCVAELVLPQDSNSVEVGHKSGDAEGVDKGDAAGVVLIIGAIMPGVSHGLRKRVRDKLKMF